MESLRQDILQYIRFNRPGIEEKILKEKNRNIDLFEEDNGFNLREDKEMWDEDYIDLLLVKLRKNFSEKKLNHLIEVRNYVRGEIQERKISDHKTSYSSPRTNKNKGKEMFEKGKEWSKEKIEKGKKFIESFSKETDKNKKKVIDKKRESFDKYDSK